MSATLIDNIFTNLKHDHLDATNKELGISDHKCQILYAKIRNHKRNHNNTQMEYRDIRVHSNENIKLFGDLLETQNWKTTFTEHGSIDEWYDKFVSIVKYHYNTAFPTRK